MSEQHKLNLVKDGLVRVAEAALFLGVSRSAVYDLIYRGELPSAVVGRRGRKVPRRALEEYAAGRLTSALVG